ncbi:hypothetical protein M404DRAFT_31685 [Pisolithus tinctorius Marx 270]|uniref:Uncharacterized protein n=1 Tax=Pisolithus tinctorius Marx 270 TaxID=870435 RepID=A0A0C3NA54_PISTI|nr:hypothetical protein M404DRAFT_31685 [Pisolithus tinctorius Marx 270]
MSNPAQSRSIERTSFDYFVIWVDSGPGQTEERLLVHREQIWCFFMYNRALRRNEGDPLDIPAGYCHFREAYHCRATTRSRFTYLEPGTGHHIVITGPAPTREEVLGVDADLRSREEIEGGQQRELDASTIAPSEVIRTAEIIEETIVDQRGLRPADVVRPLSATITSSSTSTLDMDPPFDTLADPAHITINHLNVDSIFSGLDDKGEYGEDYDSIADAEGEVDETMPQDETAGSAGDAAL